MTARSIPDDSDLVAAALSPPQEQTAEPLGELGDELLRARRWFWRFALLHLVAWTLLPLAIYATAPLDVVEMRYLGHEWQLGYHKHPPLPSWIAEAAGVLGGGGFWGVYLVSQLGTVAAFWAVWRLGREMLPPRVALVGACLLECNYYYTFATPQYNNNISMYPFWALTILFFYWGLDSGQKRYWIASGVALGLTMLCKYSAGILAVAIVLFLLVQPQARRAWRSPGPYLAILAAVVVFSPHLVWAVAHRFPSLSYAGNRSNQGPFLWGHLTCPLDFLFSQLLVLVPMAAAALPLLGYRWQWRPCEAADRFRRDFLLGTVLGPFLLYLVFSAALNRKLLSDWGSPLWMFFGLMLLFCWKTRATEAQIRAVLARCAAVGILFVVALAIQATATPYLLGEPLRTHYPGPALAAAVHQQWSRRYEGPVPIVAGDWWLASLVALNEPSRPQIFGGSDLNVLDMGRHCSGRTTERDLLTRGGVLVWDAGRYGGRPPDELKSRFPNAEFLDPIALPWQTGANIPPLQLGLAIIPPAAF